MILDPSRPQVQDEAPRDAARPLNLILANLILTGVYFAFGKFGLKLAVVNPSASAIWPSTGIAIAAMVVLGYRVWPAIFLGAFLVNITTQGSTLTDGTIAIGNTLEALAGAWLVRRYANGTRTLERAGDLFRFVVFAGLVGTMLSATIGATSLCWAGLAPRSQYTTIWTTWWLGDMSGALLIAPLLLSWWREPRIQPRSDRMIEAGMTAALAIALNVWVFGGYFGAGMKGYPVAYFAILPLLWAAFRFGPRGASSVAVLTCALAVWGTAQGLGPFATVGKNTALVLLQTFMATITLAALLLAAMMHEHALAVQATIAAKNLAEAANQAKDRFLAMLSHELRTPLTPVLIGAQELEARPELSPEARDIVAMIRRNTELESRLIDDLLDLTRIARGRLLLELREVDVHGLIRDALEMCRSDINQAGIIVEVHLESQRHHVRGDSARLQEVFWNLVKNAVKFTPRGGKISIGSQDEPGEMMRVEVIDTGVGIDAELLPKIFEAFEQGAQPIAQRSGGLGLGLAISKALVTMHQGRLSAASGGANQGSAFTVVLPTITAPVIPTEPRATNLSRRDKPLHILVVDDHDDTARTMQRLLQRLGHDAQTAGTVESALAKAKENSFDLLISDIGLPDGSGLDLMREIARQHPSMMGIALSGYGMEDDLQRSREAGFAEHLTKPVDFKKLQIVIDHLTAAII